MYITHNYKTHQSIWFFKIMETPVTCFREKSQIKNGGQVFRMCSP